MNDHSKVVDTTLLLSTGDKDTLIDVVDDSTTVHEVVQRKCQHMENEDINSFHAIDIGRIMKMYDQWTKLLPNVTPFYAYKCNSDPVMVRLLAELGTGFDCASKAEIEAVLDLGVSPERIIFANPCKMISHLKYAAQHGVKKMTFDCETELYKAETHFKDAELIVRIRPDNPHEDLMGIKYGCSVDEAVQLLEVAKRLQLNVIGVSFHIGLKPTVAAYKQTIRSCQSIFCQAECIGYKLSLLDIGGGFPGDSKRENIFHQTADSIGEVLKEFVECHPDTRMVAEPGQYFAAGTHTLALMIHSKKTRSDGTRVYYLSDGSFGSFAACEHFQWPQPNTLKTFEATVEKIPSELWGPICAPDKIANTTLLPELEIGDWLYFKDIGAYSTSFGSHGFNGFPRPKCYYYVSDKRAQEIFHALADTLGQTA